MAASRLDIACWFDAGVRDKATHLIVMTDTFDWEDYPVYVRKGEDPRKVAAERTTSMQVVTEVYDLSKNMTEQLDAKRVFNY